MTRVPESLRRHWWLTAGVFCLLSVVAAAVVAHSFDTRSAVRWLLPVGVVAGYEVWFLSTHLGRNHSSETDADPNPTLGVANAVTLGRGWLYAAVAGFLLLLPPVGSPWRWLPVLLYGGGAALDSVDGWVARALEQETALGAKLDMAFDTLGFLVAPLVAVVWGRLPIWYLSLSAARYLFKLGRGWRRRRSKPVYDLPPSRVRRPLAGLQMAFIAFALVPVVPVAVVAPLALLVVTPSLLVFGRDYLVVAGYLEARNG